LQEIKVDHYYNETPLHVIPNESIVLEYNNKKYLYSDAILKMFNRLKFPFSWIPFFLTLIPKKVRDKNIVSKEAVV
jgi:predicted DCC family thiol-disulfide oxidoreductase YuxK